MVILRVHSNCLDVAPAKYLALWVWEFKKRGRKMRVFLEAISTLIRFILKILGILTFIAVIATVSALPTWLLWNWLMPEVFGLKEITLIQALGINFLSGILFKSTIDIKD